MRFFATSIFLIFFSFVSLKSVSFLWQEENSISVAAFQIEEEEDSEVHGERMKEILEPINCLVNNLVKMAIVSRSYYSADDAIDDDVHQCVPYSPPDLVIG